MSITITYVNQDINQYASFEQIPNFNLVVKIDCSNNQLTSLPTMNFPNLQEFNCSINQLTSLPTMNFPNLQEFNCSYNPLTSLPVMNFPNLQKFNCINNQLTSLPIMNFPNLQEFSCSYNQLTSLPTMNLPNLQEFNCFANQLTSLPTMNFPNLQKFSCSYNQLTSLPTMNLPNLQNFNCSANKLTSLPIMNFPNLQEFSCSFNQLTSLPIMNLHNLQKFNCSANKLTSLPVMNFPNLQILNCNHNQLTSLPVMNFPNLQILNCNHNQLTSLPVMNFPNLHEFNCSYNRLTTLPICILNFRHLQKFMYQNNAIEMSLQIARFLDRINNLSINRPNIYTDKQNVHNSTIQLCVRDSINNITTRTDLKKYDIVLLHTLIIENTILTETSKSLLFEYVADTTVHSLLLLTFSEVLWFIIQTILTDFQIEEQQEIFKVLNQEIKDADCKCFTGRMNRVINCLNGFSPLVNINIKDGEQIGNIIMLVKNKLELTGTYTVEQHKLEVEKELLERNYDIDTIKKWLEYIE